METRHPHQPGQQPHRRAGNQLPDREEGCVESCESDCDTDSGVVMAGQSQESNTSKQVARQERRERIASYLDGGCSGGERSGGLGSSLLIPEISLQAPTPRAVTPCPSPSSPSPAPSPGRQSGQQISEADWDRMEALAEEERLASLEDNTDVFVVTNENKEKLLDFMQNPKVDISKSRLALELGVILEEAKRRMEEDLFQSGGSIPSKKKKKKKCKEVKFEELSSPEEREMDVEEALKTLELSKHGHMDNLDQEGLLIEDGSLLDGFMDGFEEDTENEISTAKPSVEPTTADYFVVSGIIGIIALVGGLLILNKIVRD